MKIQEIRLLPLQGATPDGGWAADEDLTCDEVNLHTLVDGPGIYVDERNSNALKRPKPRLQAYPFVTPNHDNPHIVQTLHCLPALNDSKAGILDALESIRNAGHTLYVATSKPHLHAKKIIEHFGMGDFFEAVYGCELDGTRSNKVELLEFAVANVPGDAPRTMIGDRKHDLIGAIANRMRPVGVAYGYGTVEELSAAGAADIAHTPANLPEVVLN